MTKINGKEEYNFSSNEIEQNIHKLSQLGITEFSIHDEEIAKNKQKLIKLMKLFASKAPDVYVSFFVDANVIDKELIQAASQVFCSLDIPLKASQKGDKVLFDKKFYAKKAALLNNSALVFGFVLDYAILPNDTLKLFLERLDFAIEQYPNHIDFPQTQDSSQSATAKVTGLFSAKDIRYARDVSFACRTFYSSGRAVTWMNSLLQPLRIHPSKFFSDFAEWQRCNNCDFKSGFVPEVQNHQEIEKMQLLFLEQKFEEKNHFELIPLINDIVKLNGAMSRLIAENVESKINTMYHPDDIFGPESLDILSFHENVCQQPCQVQLKIENNDIKINVL